MSLANPIVKHRTDFTSVPEDERIQQRSLWDEVNAATNMGGSKIFDIGGCKDDRGVEVFHIFFDPKLDSGYMSALDSLIANYTNPVEE